MKEQFWTQQINPKQKLLQARRDDLDSNFPLFMRSGQECRPLSGETDSNGFDCINEEELDNQCFVDVLCVLVYLNVLSQRVVALMVRLWAAKENLKICIFCRFLNSPSIPAMPGSFLSTTLPSLFFLKKVLFRIIRVEHEFKDQDYM